MSIDEIKNSNGMLSDIVVSRENVDYMSIEDYVLATLGIEKSAVENPAVFFKNYVHLMCHLCKDIKEIEKRLESYKARYRAIENEKSNELEFERRKLRYFCDLNKEALREIDGFVEGKILSFLLEHNYDTLNRECEKEELSDQFYNSRYKYAWHRDYYSIDYPYGIIVKVSQYVRERYELDQLVEEEQKLLRLYSDSSEQFWNQMDRYVESDHIMQKVLERVASDYHLHKRQEIFETLSVLFYEKKYQSFITLGLIQIEGLFDDYCQIRYGESDNQGTLVEKAKKTLEANEYNLLRMYPYFAFDIPIVRNEVAHKGMMRTEDAKRMAYDLVLDLNTLSQMVKSESVDKFVCAIMMHKKLVEWKFKNNSSDDELYDVLLHELLMFDKMANDHFWKVLKNPENYKKEIEFYRKIDLPQKIDVMSQLIRSEGIWKAMHRLVKNHITSTSRWTEVEDFARRMKNEYIAILKDAAKTECIEVGKIVG